MKNQKRFPAWLAGVIAALAVLTGLGTQQLERVATGNDNFFVTRLQQSDALATQSQNGTLSAADKAKLDGLSSTLSVDAVSTGSLGESSATLGTAGVGGTLVFTASPATIDGVTQAVAKKFLYLHSSSPDRNGVYVWTTYASGGAGLATRVSGYDTASTIPGGRILVTGGATKRSATYVYTATAAVTMGTTRIFYERTDAQRTGVRWTDEMLYGLAIAGNNTTGVYLTTPHGLVIGAFGTTTFFSPVAGIANRMGVMRAATGAVANSQIGAIPPSGSAPQPGLGNTWFAQDYGFRLSWDSSVHVLSNGTQEFAVLGGMMADRTVQSKNFTNGAGFLYDRTSAVSTTNYLASCRNAGSGTAVDTGITADVDGFHRFGVRKDPGDTNIYLTLDGFSTTCASGSYLSTTVSAPGWLVHKSVGTTTVDAADIDVMSFADLTPERN